MEEAGEAAFLITEGKNRRYLSGFTGSSGWLLVTRDVVYVITDGRYWEQVERQCSEVELFRYLPSEHQSSTGALAALLSGPAKLAKGAAVGFELDEVTISSYRSVASMLAEEGYLLHDVEGRVKRLRVFKDAAELELLAQAAAIADAALSAALERFEEGMSELALKAEIDYQVLRRGGEGAAFPTIVASGVNGSYPHAGASEKPIRTAELVTIDFGAVWRGYCSDMTRTVWLGELSEHDQRLVRAVAMAQGRAVEAARPGLTAGELDEVARAYLREEGLADYFVHSLGHGIGLDVHESPTLRSGQTERLEAAQVITIEPGVYLPGRTGCRIEDTVVLEADGCRVLNQHPKQLLEHSSPPLRKL